jgi:hypothetical protein
MAEYTTPYAPVPNIPFNCKDSPRNIPILDSGVGGQFRGGGVDGGVNGALCMAKNGKTEDKNPVDGIGSCKSGPKEQKEMWPSPVEMDLNWTFVLSPVLWSSRRVEGVIEKRNVRGVE